MLKKIREFFVGSPLNPFDAGTRKHIALVAFLAWIGLGADGLSSSAYGPEEAYLALGSYHYLALFLALGTAITVFIIAVAYNQVIELFPSGGGGYKVATMLVGKHAGLVSGAALIVDYVLTIAISVASGMNTILSLLPLAAQNYKIYAEVAAIIILLVLNLRGMKESIKVLVPIFLGFVITHFIIITYGIYLHGSHLPDTIYESVHKTHTLALSAGWFFMLSLFMRAYSMGGGTYTGLEAISNNVNCLAEPRIKTGKWTMFYMALSLSVTAGGIILLYLLWHAQPQDGKTLNAIVFSSILERVPYQSYILIILLLFEAGLLFVAANAGFLGGPAVLANMAMDGWTPKRFRNLSSRLVAENGVVIFGIFALLILLLTHGQVSTLVVLYSINVFITFTLSVLGLCIYWWKNRRFANSWRIRLTLSLVGFIVCAAILLVMIVEKFTAGGWMTMVITSVVIGSCLLIKRHYDSVQKQVKILDKLLTLPISSHELPSPKLEPNQPTAVFLVGDSIGMGIHTLLWVQRMFPGCYKNFVFISSGVVDVGSYGSDEALSEMQKTTEARLKYFVDFCHSHGFAAESCAAYGNDPIEKIVELVEEVNDKFSACIFFGASMIYKVDNWFTRKLHSDTSLIVQRYLHLKGLQMLILPVRLER